VDYLVWKTDAMNCDPGRITVELLETTGFVLTEGDATLRNLCRLRTAGFPIYLDDFGMGYAGLAHLASLDVQGLKIDKKVTSALETDTAARSIFEAIVDLADKLGLTVIAEGVETEAQKRLSVEAGCTLLQGFGVARPMPLEQALRYARRQSPYSKAAS
ncbi:MAG: EAL domain-containing protein, partial [Pseudomonadota bacterium]